MRNPSWSASEIASLVSFHRSSCPNVSWTTIAKQVNVIHKQQRCNKQCRKKHVSLMTAIVNPSDNRPWSKAEIDLLDRTVKEHGKKWTWMSFNLFEHRTDNACKNAYAQHCV